MTDEDARQVQRRIAELRGFINLQYHGDALMGAERKLYNIPDTLVVLYEVPNWPRSYDACFTDLWPELIKYYKGVRLFENEKWAEVEDSLEYVLTSRNYGPYAVCEAICEAWLQMKEIDK